MLLGAGVHKYRWVSDWGRLADGKELGNTHGCLAVDKQGRIYANTDTEAAVVVFAPDGALLGSWGKEFRGGLHGMCLREEDGKEFLYLAHTGRHEVVKATLDGTGPRYRFNHATGTYTADRNTEPYTGVIVGARSDEEGSRSKERYFSPRNQHHTWDIAEQPPEFWNQYKTDFAPGTHVRIHPLLDWTELNIWEYIGRERIPVVPLYFDHGTGRRYRSLGCAPCTSPVDSTARTVEEIIDELRTGRFSQIAERSGRAQDAQDDGGLETLRRDGYM